MNRDFVATMHKGSLAFATAVAVCVLLLGGCGVKGPLRLPTPPPPATGALPSAPPSTTTSGAAPASPQGAAATDTAPSAPKTDASTPSGAPSAPAPQPTERAP